MALIKYTDVGILGISACVPKNVINNYEYTEYFSKEDVKDVVDKIGVIERRFVSEDQCSSDLCFVAAEKLIEDLEINKEEIDLLIFVSQTPDYRMPATAISLQNRLGLSKSTMAFDISLGCSGFIYGLSTVYAFMQSGNFKKALLLNGETRSKVYSAKDRKTAFLFGDAGSAVIVEYNEKYRESYFSLNSDGSLEDLIKIEGGGYRQMSSTQTIEEKVIDDYGNIRNAEQGVMKGADVFNFVLKEVPSDFKRLISFGNINIASVDYFVFHQANEFMNSYLAKKLKVNVSKVPSSIAKFGNTSSVSIPLTIVSELKNKLEGRKEIFLAGFGVGMSWGCASIVLNDCFVSSIVEI
ncbi:3-oxoacyl-ACP synthase III family protein [Myroides odoratimimus]|uniref:3-oxoacyl-ACP synthase III family protein n=1 Tax=Myroides odoratimimus TaxID=76832 RepID=UPI002576298E|nr:ketoacyl-ACP synthase III [Myroides odoratimimus]MDM1039137.1 ketoacyl-ACP synthase III [Myroides odoratimimus]MDM1053324.1 ketoacyl-ACP synthase III [Myroides odoratimimus]